jgi:hypothetical protein
MKTALEKNIQFEDDLLERCRWQLPTVDAEAAVYRALNQLEYEDRRNRQIVRQMAPELQRVFGGK